MAVKEEKKGQNWKTNKKNDRNNYKYIGNHNNYNLIKCIC